MDWLERLREIVALPEDQRADAIDVMADYLSEHEPVYQAYEAQRKIVTALCQGLTLLTVRNASFETLDEIDRQVEEQLQALPATPHAETAQLEPPLSTHNVLLASHGVTSRATPVVLPTSTVYPKSEQEEWLPELEETRDLEGRVDYMDGDAHATASKVQAGNQFKNMLAEAKQIKADVDSAQASQR
jgi:hypothetical protein